MQLLKKSLSPVEPPPSIQGHYKTYQLRSGQHFFLQSVSRTTDPENFERSYIFECDGRTGTIDRRSYVDQETGEDVDYGYFPILQFNGVDMFTSFDVFPSLNSCLQEIEKCFLPSPGSGDAVERGCICPVTHNRRGAGATEGDGFSDFWVEAGCLLHGD